MVHSLTSDTAPDLATAVAARRERDGEDAWAVGPPTEGHDVSGRLHVRLDAARRVLDVRVDHVDSTFRTAAGLLAALQDAWTAAELERVIRVVEQSPRRREYERYGQEVLAGIRRVDLQVPPPVTVPRFGEVRGAADRWIAERATRAAAGTGERTGRDNHGRITVTIGAADRPAAVEADERWLAGVWPADLGEALLEALRAASDDARSAR